MVTWLGAAARPLRVAFHAINGVGLGHLVRAISIATELPALVPGVERLVVTNARDPSLLVAAGLDFVQLPPRLDEPHADPRRIHAALPGPLEEAALLAALAAFAPDLVVFDTHAPPRVVQRLAALGARAVLVLRELRPEALRAFVASPAALAFDRIVVPHEPAEVDLAAFGDLPVVATGPIVRAMPRETCAAVGDAAREGVHDERISGRARVADDQASAGVGSHVGVDERIFGAAQVGGDEASVGGAGAGDRMSGAASAPCSGGPLIVAIGGGGGQPVDARRYLRAVADAHLLARARIPALETVLVTGPYAAPPAHVEGFAGLTVVSSPPDLPALLARAALVVSQAGYNAVAELRSLEKPAILVPAYRKAEDQRVRARRLVRAGAAAIARPRAREIADRIEALVLEPGALEAMARAHRAIPLVPGNRAAAEAVLRPVWIAGERVRRVALVAHDFAPRLGGMETVARGLADGLIARGVEVAVYTASRLGARAGELGDRVRPLYRPVAGHLQVDRRDPSAAGTDAGGISGGAGPDRRDPSAAGTDAGGISGGAGPDRRDPSAVGGDADGTCGGAVQDRGDRSAAGADADGAASSAAGHSAPQIDRALRIDLWADLLSTIDAALRDAPDVIHLCHAGLGPWIPALRAALPCAVTASVHGNDLLAPWVHHGGDGAAYRDAQAAGLAAADAVVCVSRFSRGLAAGRGVPDDRLHVVENGADPARFGPGARDPALAARLGLDERDEIVLTVSRLAPRKGHRTALRAIAALARDRPRLRYVFTGAGEAMRAELAALAAELGIAGRVIAAGFVSDAELPALYRLADAFVLLAESDAGDVEGFGVALLEAAATGVPVVAAASGGVPEAVGDAGLLVPPGDPRAAAAAIARLLDDRALARDLGERGRARVTGELSQDRATERMLAIWTRALAHGARRPIGDASRALCALASAGFADSSAAAGGVALVRLAQRHHHARRAERARRREALADAVARGRRIRLRAIGDGARLLPEALDGCAALGHAPIVELKLRRFVEPDFVAYALPAVDSVELVHSVPYAGAAALLARLGELPAAALDKVRALRLFASPAAEAEPRIAASAVPETHALRRRFAARGAVVVPPPELMRYLSELPAGGPATAMIEPTNLCNLACPTCPTGTGKIAPRPAMTLDQFAHAIGELPRLRNLALWNYGEPLLNKQLPQMIAHAKRAGVGVVKVSSNVHFLDGERGRALLGSGLDVLILSVDGASQATYQMFRRDGDFERVARAVAWLCGEKRRLELRRPRIELQFIAMRHNEHELPEMRRLAREWGVDALRIKTVGADDDATRDLVPVSSLLSRYAADGETPSVRHPFCTMAWDHTVINVDGSVTPCCYLRPDMGPEFVMGNAFEAPFAQIWRGERYRAFRARMLDDRGAMPVCNRCRGGTHDLIAAVEEVAR